MEPRTATARRLLAALGLTVTAVAAAGCSSAPKVVAPPAPSAEAPSSSVPSPTEPPPTSVTPLPLARDGSNLKACQSGHCQVLISGPTTLTVGDLTLSAAVDSGGVTVTGADSNDNHVQVATAVGGTNMIGLSGHTIKVRVLGIQGNRAVLDLS